MNNFTFKGEIEELKQGIAQLCEEEIFIISDNGFEIDAIKGDNLCININKEKAEIVYPYNAAFFRGLSLVLQHFGEEWKIEETPCFDKNGVMLDCSRNAVLKPETVKYILRKMALMGLNTAMLYTEDTYEIPDEPYFGYLRGRFTQSELKELDDYAYALGIELIPCIQTLSHLEGMLKWREYSDVSATSRTLFVSEERTYELIEKMIVAASAPFRTNRIHIGMDEAADVIDGNYRKKHGDTIKKEVLREHLRRVHDIIKKHDLQGMMWGDMFIEDDRKDVPQDLQLVNWNYYAELECHYKNSFDIYARVTDNVIFAGGTWTWLGMGVDYVKTMITTQCALTQCMECGCKEIFVTAWGDDGGETNLLSALYGMQVYAEFGYKQSFDSKNLEERFYACTGQSAENFLKLSEFVRVPGDKIADAITTWSKDLLYEDSLLPIFEKDREPLNLTAHYKKLFDSFKSIKTNDNYFCLLWEYYAVLAQTLSEKSMWFDIAPKAVRKRDLLLAKKAIEQGEKVVDCLEKLQNTWYRMWYLTNKPQGFEVIDIRIGGQISRFKTAVMRMRDFAAEKIDTIEELAEPKLLYMRDKDGGMHWQCRWNEIVSAGHMYHF